MLGYSDLKIISSKQARQISDHGITCDFTVIKVSIEHQQVESLEGQNGQSSGQSGHGGGVSERDEEGELSLAFQSQSTIDDSQNRFDSQSSQSTFAATQTSSTTSTGTNMEGDNEESPETFEDLETDGYSVVFAEKSPNSSMASRPIFR